MADRSSSGAWDLNSKVITDGSTFRCGMCGTFPKTHEELLLHISNHLELSEELCEECGARFPNKTALIAHKKQHNSASNFPCRQCGHICQSKAGLWSHTRTHQVQKRIYQCQSCDKSYFFEGFLEFHLSQVHKTSTKQCILCPLVFDTFVSLQQHMLQEHECNLEGSWRKKPAKYTCTDEKNRTETEQDVIVID